MVSEGGVVSRGFVVVVVALVVEDVDDDEVVSSIVSVVVGSSEVVVVSRSWVVGGVVTGVFGLVSVTRRARIADATLAEN